MSKLVFPVLSEDESEAVQTVLDLVIKKRILVAHDEDRVMGALEALRHAPVKDDVIDVDPAAKQLGPFARKSDTSRQAAVANYPRSGSQRATILAMLVGCGGRGATREELAEALRMPHNSVRPRVRELLDGGWVQLGRDEENPGQLLRRKTSLGNWSEVLVATDKGIDQAPAS